MQFSFLPSNVLSKFVLFIVTFAISSYFLGRSIKSSSASSSSSSASASSSSSSASASYRPRHPRRPHRRDEHHHHHHDRRYQHPIIIAISIIINAFVVFCRKSLSTIIVIVIIIIVIIIIITVIVPIRIILKNIWGRRWCNFNLYLICVWNFMRAVPLGLNLIVAALPRRHNSSLVHPPTPP